MLPGGLQARMNSAGAGPGFVLKELRDRRDILTVSGEDITS